MPNFKHLVIGWLCCLASFGSSFLASAVRAQDADAYVAALDLFPDSVGGFLRIVDFPSASEAWKKTSLSALADDPAMEPFWESQRANAEQELLNRGLKVGVRLNDLREIASGEVVAGWLTFSDPKRPYAVTLVTDVRGRQDEAKAVLTRIDDAMEERQATRNDVRYGDQTIRVYTLRRAPGQLQIQQVAITLNEQRLIASDRQVVVEQLLDAISGQESNQQRLVDADDFQEVMTRVGDPEANEFHWFARPLSFARIMREVAETDRGNRVDIVKLLEGQGFDAVRAGGGRVQIAEDEFDLLHRGFIWAPTPSGQTERFLLAARMLQFPNTPLEPFPKWVGEGVASCLRMNWQMNDAFWAAETLVDEAFGDEIFRPTLEGIKEDPEGPQIDIPDSVIANFDDQLILLTDNIEPADPDSERMLVAVRLSGFEEVAEAIREAMESEPDATRLEAIDHPAWKVVPRDEPLDFEDDLFDDFGFEADALPQEERPAPLLEQWAISVVEGPAEDGDGTVAYLIFSSHAEMLVDAVRRIQDPPAQGLANEEGVRAVFERLEQLGGDRRSLDRVNRLNESWRTKYELLRQGKLRESGSFLASLVRRLAEGDEVIKEPENRSAAKLPAFQVIEGYLHPVGSFLHTEDDGWSLVGFLLADPAASEE